MKECNLIPLDLSFVRSGSPPSCTGHISPGGCRSADDVEMGSPISWCGSLVVPERPRTSEPAGDVRPHPTPRAAGIPPEKWRILPGRYVAFALNTDSLVASAAEGSDHRAALEAFAGRRYLGLVVTSTLHPLEDESGAYAEDVVAMYVGAAPPPGPAAPLCLPIAPCRLDCEGEAADGVLTPVRPFPFANRRQWTAFGAECKVDEDVFAALEEVFGRDFAALEALCADMHAPLLDADESGVVTTAKLRVAPPTSRFQQRLIETIQEAQGQEDEGAEMESGDS
ncbi:uncharacterized protein BXZ73DRAFT_103636 [Epithele typhae]|uniref:uncharacterized protein n=1 Tax=Epithele typhae TaxID=378194 RepID=UPI002007B539|nr:uncharacterized protein BXZ73DRAFT_103636 [Epithele typhae]KAH9924347.1 hypothetical protein BXZ73DRAFT_103636 [Epithele typhae]